MLSSEEYIRKSIGYELFWLRIMKEHAVFIESAIPPINAPLAKQADQFKVQYEQLLSQAIGLANGAVSKEALQSGQYYTRFTEEAELVVQQATGIEINRNLTRAEYNIVPFSPASPIGTQKEQEISQLNRSAMELTKSFAQFKADLFNSQISCRLITFLYPADLNHILMEANRFLGILTDLQAKNERADQNYKAFWTQNMSDHAKSMRGLFDPTEAKNFATADQFVRIYEGLIRSAEGNPAPTREDLSSAENLSTFKANTTQGLIECKIRSLMNALYTDHLLREANHFIYLMRT